MSVYLSVLVLCLPLSLFGLHFWSLHRKFIFDLDVNLDKSFTQQIYTDTRTHRHTDTQIHTMNQHAHVKRGNFLFFGIAIVFFQIADLLFG